MNKNITEGQSSLGKNKRKDHTNKRQVEREEEPTKKKVQ